MRALVLKLATCPRTLWVGLNFRADWSPNELRLNRKLFVPTIKPPMPVKNVALPTMWDWRRAANDKVTPAKDQGRCGSAFAFAAVAAVESKLLIQYGKTNITYPIDLSEQQVVDCVRAGQGSYRSAGCEGGSLEEPLDYAARCAVLCCAALRCAARSCAIVSLLVWYVCSLLCELFAGMPGCRRNVQVALCCG